MLRRRLSRPLPAAWAKGCCVALFVLLCAGCRTTGPIAQSSTDFRLQNIEAALVKIQGEVQALEARQAEGDKTWGEVRTKLDELAQLVRARTGEPGAASAQDAPPPWAGQSMAPAGLGAAAAGPSSPSAPASPAASPADRPPKPYGASDRAALAQNGKGQPAQASDVGRPFPATPPGQTARAVQAAASSEPTPFPMTPDATPASPEAAPSAVPGPPSPAAELAAAGASVPIPAPVSAPATAAAPGGNQAKTWELPGPGDAVVAVEKPGSTPTGQTGHTGPVPATPASTLSPYPPALPPVDGAAPPPVTPVATAVQAAGPASGPVPTPYAAPSGPAPSAAPAAPASGKASPGQEADYNRALKLALNGKPREAKAAFNEFLARHPHSALEPNVRYWIGESDYILGDMSQAAQSFTDVSTRYAGHHKAADSLYKLGMVQEKLGNTAAARTAYESLVKDYPASELAGNAKRKLEQLPR
ncbi:MAG: tol-pal system protein YbgF [Desulfovibrionaceae bacterium]|nr:tol-pal system protein YbgF [Desulfovibrionaceae bacterium]